MPVEQSASSVKGVCDMLIGEQIAYLRRYYPTEWHEAYKSVEVLAKRHSLICPCGQITTKMHRSTCMRYRRMVDTEVAYNLRHLLPKRYPAAVKR